MMSYAWLVVCALSALTGLVTVSQGWLLIWLALKGASAEERVRLLPKLAIALRALRPWARDRTVSDRTSAPEDP